MSIHLHKTIGSRKAIEIAQRNIPMALQVLDNAINTANSLENSAVSMFREHAEQFFEIIGPSAANFAEQKAECDAAIISLEREKQILIDGLAEAQGELEKYNNLVHVTEIRVNGTEAALKETRLRTEQMQKLNNDVDNAIKAIPETINQTETTRTTGLWFWRKSTTTKTVCRKSVFYLIFLM